MDARKPAAQLVYLLDSASGRSSIRSLGRNPSVSNLRANASEAQELGEHLPETAKDYCDGDEQQNPDDAHASISSHENNAFATFVAPVSPSSSLPSYTHPTLASAPFATEKDGEDASPASSGPTGEKASMEDEPQDAKAPAFEDYLPPQSDDRKLTLKDVEQCPLCFHIPNRAKRAASGGEAEATAASAGTSRATRRRFPSSACIPASPPLPISSLPSRCPAHKQLGLSVTRHMSLTDPSLNQLLECCGKRVVCSLCARSWLRKSDSCPFCRAHIAYPLRKYGLPDAVELQAVLDTLDVLCPYADGGCSWIGARKDLKEHIVKDCVVAVDPETREPAPGLIRISEFCLDKKWSNSPSRTAGDVSSSRSNPSSGDQPMEQHRTTDRHVNISIPYLSHESDAPRSSRRNTLSNDDSSTRRLTSLSAGRVETGSEDGRDAASSVATREGYLSRFFESFVMWFRALYLPVLIFVVFIIAGLIIGAYQGHIF
ncbi:hypothetical protein HDU67_002041 [Dinochytrium kinnereticum]|nr:hypothetical protein HDU67_002041 [Dinochytrium kinnereticum]